MKRFFMPNVQLSKSSMKNLVIFEAVVALLIWTFSPSPMLPKPGEVLSAFSELWRQGLGAELITSFVLNLQAIVLATLISLVLSYASVLPLSRPIVALISKLRFLSLVGLTFVFTLVATSGHELKLSLLVFLITVFFVTSMVDVIGGVRKEKYDLARTLRMGEWRVVWEVIVLGEIDAAFDVIRQNAAMGWASITLIESMVRSEGGIGAMLMDQNHHFRLSAVFAIQLTILISGLIQDYGIGIAKEFVCPYSVLALERA